MDSTTDVDRQPGDGGQTRPEGGDSSAGPEPPENGAGRARRYQRMHLLLTAARFVAETVILAVFAATGWSVAIRSWATGLSENPWVVVLLYALPLGAVFGAVWIAFSAVRTFGVDRRFGQSRQGPADWLADVVKALAVAGVLWLAALEVFYALLRWYPQAWWLLAVAVFGALLFFFVQVAPVVIFPLFFKFKRLTDEEITGRVERLARLCGAEVEGVFEFNLSRKSPAANAGLAGIGRTRRIILADTLLDSFTLDEIETVLAHELAHHARGHLTKGILIQLGMFLILFLGLDLVLDAASGRWGLKDPADVANLPIVGLAGTAILLVLLPITNGVLRRFEKEADDFAVDVANRPGALCSALRRLGQLNLEDSNPHPLIEWWLYSHPALGSRIARIEKKIASLDNRASEAEK